MQPILRLAIHSRRFPWPLRYALSTCLVLLAVGLRSWALGAQAGVPYALFYPVVMVTGIAFDRGSSIYAVILGAILGTYFFVAPSGGFPSGWDTIGLVVFLCTAGTMAIFLESLHEAFGRLAEAKLGLERSNSKLREANARLSKAETISRTLMRETIHRFQNDLQRLGATVSMQRMAANDAAIRAALANVEQRIVALGSIKARLNLRLVLEEGTTLVESDTFLSGLIEDWGTFAGRKPVSVAANIERHPLPASVAVTLGLVLNELLTNAMKYAFPPDVSGQVTIEFSRSGDHFILRVSDTGVGFDPGGPPKGSGLGMRITKSLAKQIGGSLEVHSAAGSGTVCTLAVPVPERRDHGHDPDQPVRAGAESAALGDDAAVPEASRRSG